VKPLARLLVVFVLATLAVIPAATAANRMWMGFHDDPVFRWNDGRMDELDKAVFEHATIIRTLVTWADVAPTKPASATDPFDPAYKLDDVDELVRNAQQRGIEVLITIWGTPKWANGDKTPNVAPTNMNDFRQFAQAIAARYSGRYAGYPFVRFYGVWNESNLGQFLSPQFDASGKIVSPATYAQLAAAAIKGIKAGNPKALVAIGETSSHGRDKPLSGNSDTVSPGMFAQLVAKANPRLKFDAWAHHPYPFPVFQKPSQKVKWPNVSLTSLPRFETSLDSWFHRKNIPIWITEYGHETKPGEPFGVTEAQQAAYLPQAIALAKKDPRVQMFIWFVFRDSQGSTWQSGLYRENGAAKPALAKWRRTVPGLDARNPYLTVKGGTRNPLVSLVVREICSNNAPGSVVGMTYRVYAGKKFVKVGQTSVPLGKDCTVAVRPVYRFAKGKTYTMIFIMNTYNGVIVQRTATIATT
jgi:aryl-phospho-beta-D-glucosidase BglC (GH1 family)